MITELKNKKIIDTKIKKYNSFTKWYKETIQSIFVINDKEMQSILNKF